MPVLCRPAVHVPEYSIGLDETISLCRDVHTEPDRLELARRLIHTTGVKRRHLVRPPQETMCHQSAETCNLAYIREAKARVPAAVAEALASARLTADQIDAVVFVSCTRFATPELVSWLGDKLGLRPAVRLLPIVHLDCAAGGVAVNLANSFCLAHPEASVLIVSCELCSLRYQPTDLTVKTLLSNGLFGDAVAAAVVRGTGGTGMRLECNMSCLVLGRVSRSGSGVERDPRVAQLASVLQAVAAGRGWDSAQLDFYLIHAGAAGTLDDLSCFLRVKSQMFGHTRATLAECGNIASAVVLDAFRRLFDAGGLEPGMRGMIGGLGSSLTAEIVLGTWTSEN